MHAVACAEDHMRASSPIGDPEDPSNFVPGTDPGRGKEEVMTVRAEGQPVTDRVGSALYRHSTAEDTGAKGRGDDAIIS